MQFRSGAPESAPDRLDCGLRFRGAAFAPLRFACGLAPLSHRLPLKGGVILERLMQRSVGQS